MTKKIQLALLIIIPAVVPTALFGQVVKVTTNLCLEDARPDIQVYCRRLVDFQNAVNDRSIKATEEGLTNTFFDYLDLSRNNATVNFVSVAARSAAAQEAMSYLRGTRPDQQLGAGGASSGTTSLVSKAGSAALLSIALDSGALTRTVNGSTVTLATNADAIYRFATGNNPLCTVDCDHFGWFENKVLNHTNFSASLDLAQRGSTTTSTAGQASGTTATTVGSAAIPTGAGKLSGFTVRYQIMNKYDPRSEKFRKSWSKAVRGVLALKSAAQQLGDAHDKVRETLIAMAPPLNRPGMFSAAQSDPTGKKLVEFFHSYFLDASREIMQNEKIRTDITQAIQERALYRQAWFQALEQAVGNLLTVEYNYQHPSNQPASHDFKAIYAYSFKKMGMVTFNGAVSLYDTVPAGALYGRIHYGQVAGEYDRTITGNNAPLRTQFSLAGYWQYQPEPSILNIPAGTVVPGTNIPLPNGTQEFVGTAGSLWVAQAKITIKAAGGINLPFGVSWSNKTDLLLGSKVGAQVGISYDF